MFNRASIAAAAATVSARGVFSTLFFLDSRRTGWARIQSTASTSENTFVLMAAGIESLVARFALHAMKKHVQPSQRTYLYDTTYSFLFEDLLKCYLLKIQKMGRGKQCTQGKGKQCGKATISGPVSQDYGEQIPN